MARDGSGTYSLPAGTTVTTNTTIESSKYNAFVNDLPAAFNEIWAANIRSGDKTGVDTKLVTGTAGTNNYTAKWNSDGDLVDGYEVLDEDDMVSNSNTKLATQQSIKAYVDGQVDDVLTTEEVQDIAGPLVATGGTKTGITVTYQDSTNDMDFVTDVQLTNAVTLTNKTIAYASNTLTGVQEAIQGNAQTAAAAALTDHILFQTNSGNNFRRDAVEDILELGGRWVDGGAKDLTSGTAWEWTSLPSNVVMAQIVLHDCNFASGYPQVVIGDSGGYETTGYYSEITEPSATGSGVASFLWGYNGPDFSGVMTLMNVGGDRWAESSLNCRGYSGYNSYGSGQKTLSATLDRIKFESSSGVSSTTTGDVRLLYMVI